MGNVRGFPSMSTLPRENDCPVGSYGPPTLNNPDKNRRQSEHKKHVDEPSDGVPADEPESPQQQQNNKYCPEHDVLPEVEST